MDDILLLRDMRQILCLHSAWVKAGTDALKQGPTTGKAQFSGKGQWILITHLLKAVSMCGAAVRLVRDYGEDMDGTRFEHLFDFVLQKLPSGTVMENGPHHSGRDQAVPMTDLRNEAVKQRLSTRVYTGMHNSYGSSFYVTMQ